MKLGTALRNTGIAVACFLLLPGARGSDEDFKVRSNSRLVLLDVSVKDKSGEPVPGLKKEDFAVYENGRRQPITVFGREDLPITVGLLVDESFSMRPKHNDVLAAAEAFIGESNQKDEIFVLNFNDRVNRGLPKGMLFSDNPAQLRKALARGTPQGKTALNDAIIEGLRQAAEGTWGRKALVLISDGGDNASVNPRRETLNRAASSVATIYDVGLYDDGDPDRDPRLLNSLANVSGGFAYFPRTPADAKQACRAIAKDIRTRYSVGYVPPPQVGADALRHIRVSVAGPGLSNLVVKTRKSYRYEE